MRFILIGLLLLPAAEKSALLLFGNALDERDGDLHRSVGHPCGSLCKDESRRIALVLGICEDPEDLTLSERVVNSLVAEDDAVVGCQCEEVGPERIGCLGGAVVLEVSYPVAVRIDWFHRDTGIRKREYRVIPVKKSEAVADSNGKCLGVSDDNTGKVGISGLVIRKLESSRDFYGGREEFLDHAVDLFVSVLDFVAEFPQLRFERRK